MKIKLISAVTGKQMIKDSFHRVPCPHEIIRLDEWGDVPVISVTWTPESTDEDAIISVGFPIVKLI